MLVNHFLENSANNYPDKIALIHGGTRATYSEIELRSNQIANALKENGIAKGDRVAILIENSLNYVVAYYGILKAGCIVVPLYSSTVSKNLIYILNECQAKGLISNERHTKVINNALPSLSHLKPILYDGDVEQIQPIENQKKVSLDEVWQSYPDLSPDVRCIDQDIASIIFTSGSTGKPKGVTLSHLNIVTNTNSIVEYLHLTEKDRAMVVLPFPYVFGKSILNTHFKVGGSVVLENRFVFPNLVLKAIEKEQANSISGVPSTFAFLLHKSSIRKFELASLEYVTQAGGGMAPKLIRELMEVLPNVKIYIMYGATEASARLSYLEPSDLPRKIGSVGKAIPNVELKVIKGDGEEAKPGEEGQIVARGSNIMIGYWNEPEETSKVLSKYGYHTGDLAIKDEEGYLYIVGRKKNMIKVAGHRISPKEIEEVLLENDSIHEVAVIGVDDELLGEAVKAYVVPKDGSLLKEKDILQFCQQSLPEYKIPKYVEFRKRLPKNASGKIMKTELLPKE